jgi:hypothetical protein
VIPVPVGREHRESRRKTQRIKTRKLSAKGTEIGTKSAVSLGTYLMPENDALSASQGNENQ